MEKKEWQGHDLWSPLTTLFLSFHRSVDSAEHALMSIDINTNFSRRITGILAHNFFELGKKKKNKPCEISQFLISRITLLEKESCLCMGSTPQSCILTLRALKLFSIWKEKFKKLQHYHPFPSSTKAGIVTLSHVTWVFQCKALQLQVCCQGRWGSGEAARRNREMLSALPALLILKKGSK